MASAFSGCRTSFATLISIIAVLVVTADWFFYGRPIGWTIAAYTVLAWAALTFRRARWAGTGAGWVFAGALALLVAAQIEEPTLLAAGLAMACLGFLAMIDRAGWLGHAGVWVLRWIEFVGTGPFQILLDNRLVARWIRRNPGHPWGVAGILKLWILPVLLTGVFVGIFAVANPIITTWMSRLGTWLGDIAEVLPRFLDARRIFFWMIVVAVAWTVLRVRLPWSRRLRPSTSRPLPLPNTSAAPPESAGPSATTVGAVLRCLILFNAIFAIQNLLDVRYLWAGAALPEGMTYAQYAHRGAYPLIGAALLAGAIVIVAFRPGGAAERSRLARVLVYAWLLQTVALTGSSLWRLNLYVSVYTLTRPRVAAGIWMVLIAIGMAWIVWRIVTRRSNLWLVHANLLSTAAVLLACCFVNFNRFIADYNVRHCREGGGSGGPLDVRYLHELGPDALPALMSIRAALDSPARKYAAGQSIAFLQDDLRAELSDWRGWTWRRHRLAEEIRLPRDGEAAAEPGVAWERNRDAATGDLLPALSRAAREEKPIGARRRSVIIVDQNVE